MNHRTAKTEVGARLDNNADGIMIGRMPSLIYVRVYNLFVLTYKNLSVASCYKKNEQMKAGILSQNLGDRTWVFFINVFPVPKAR